MSEKDRNKLSPALHLLMAADAKAKRVSVVEAMENAGHRVDVVAEAATVEGLVEALAKHLDS